MYGYLIFTQQQRSQSTRKVGKEPIFLSRFYVTLFTENLVDLKDLQNKLQEEEIKNVHWKPFDVAGDKTFGKIINRKINFLKYGIYKDEYEINNPIIQASE